MQPVGVQAAGRPLRELEAIALSLDELEGSVREVAERYAKGQLADTGDLCRAHGQACEH